jgi:hypothetical protein
VQVAHYTQEYSWYPLSEAKSIAGSLILNSYPEYVVGNNTAITARRAEIRFPAEVIFLLSVTPRPVLGSPNLQWVLEILSPISAVQN